MKSVQTFESNSPEATLALGRRISALLPAQGPVLLIGELGAGKTTLVKGIADARHAARPDDVSSPTYTLIHEYGDPPILYHVDLYRLDTPEQARRIGLDDLLDQPALILIEWADRFPELFPPGAPALRFSSNPAAPDARIIELIESTRKAVAVSSLPAEG